MEWLIKLRKINSLGCPRLGGRDAHPFGLAQGKLPAAGTAALQSRVGMNKKGAPELERLSQVAVLVDGEHNCGGAGDGGAAGWGAGGCGDGHGVSSGRRASAGLAVVTAASATASA